MPSHIPKQGAKSDTEKNKHPDNHDETKVVKAADGVVKLDVVRSNVVFRNGVDVSLIGSSLIGIPAAAYYFTQAIAPTVTWWGLASTPVTLAATIAAAGVAGGIALGVGAVGVGAAMAVKACRKPSCVGIAIEVGTTGVGFAVIFSDRTMHMSSNWAGCYQKFAGQCVKTRSAVLVTSTTGIEEDRTEIGFTAWERFVKSTALLKPDESIKFFKSDFKVNIGTDKEANRAARRFMKEFFKVVQDFLANKTADGIDAIHKVQIVATVPALFSDVQLDEFRSILHDAGFFRSKSDVADRLSLLFEPYAAMQHFAVDLADVNNTAPPGTYVIVADAGGGTFDTALQRRSHASTASEEALIGGVNNSVFAGELTIRSAVLDFFLENISDIDDSCEMVQQLRSQKGDYYARFVDAVHDMIFPPSSLEHPRLILPPEIMGALLPEERQKFESAFEQSMDGLDIHQRFFLPTLEIYSRGIRERLNQVSPANQRKNNTVIYFVGGMAASNFISGPLEAEFKDEVKTFIVGKNPQHAVLAGAGHWLNLSHGSWWN